jgi:hypothetical protein
MNEDKTKQRLLKANNVQRRAYVKRFEVLAKRAKRFFLNDKRDAQARVENKLVEREMGADLDTLLDLRAQIQETKLKQAELVKQAEAVREELREKKGLTIQSSSYGRSAWDYYVNPPMVDTPDDPDVCKKDLGNEDVQFTVRRCQQNPLYDELLKELTALTDKHMELENDIDRIPAQIWGVVTTDEILALLGEFQTKWVHDTLIEDD